MTSKDKQTKDAEDLSAGSGENLRRKAEALARERVDETKANEELKRLEWMLSGKSISTARLIGAMIETKQTEEALRKSEETLRATLNSIGDAVISTDMGGLVAAMNPVAESLTGWSEKEATGRPLETVFRIINEQTRRPVESPVANVLKSNHVVGLANHTLLIARDGREIPIADSGAPIRDDAGEITGVVLVFRDQTQERAAQKALEKSESTIRKKLNAITEPDGDIGTLSLGDIIDAEELQTMMEDFYNITQIGSAIIDISGNVLVGVGWQDICVKFHRVHPDTAKNCLESDLALAYGVPAGTFKVYRCKNNMWDMASPIIIGGKHLGNIYLGQFFYDDERVDYELFRKQARRHGFDETEYLAALDRVLRLKRETAESTMTFYAKLAGMISSLSYSKIKLSRDIARRKQTEKELVEQKDMLAAIYRNAPLIIMVLNAERRIQQINGFAAQFAGKDAEEMLGLRGGEALRCLHVLDDPRGCGFGEFCRQCVIRNTVLDTLETGQTHLQIEAPHYFKGQDNKTRDMQFLMSTTTIEVKGERQVLVTLQDITDRKRAEAEKEKLQSQLNQAQKMESVGRLAGGVAHDFNNMLGVILGRAEMAMDQMDSSQPLFADLQEIRKAAERSANLTRQLLTFARKQTIAPRIIDLNETVEGMLKMLRRLIGEDIDLTWRPKKNLAPVKMDPAQIDQILANLCVNSRDAISGVGKITIETGVVSFDEAYCADHAGFIPGEFIMLAVSDNGCGMNPETVSRLFEPFFTTKEVGKGTGLGLASVYGAVKQNNGFINVYSEPGQGTTVKIYLPPHRAKTPLQADEATAQPTAGGSETILLVEDEPAILEMAAMMLERLGYAVIAAETPGEAIRLAREHGDPIDLLMTDVVMPEMNGRDLAQNLLSIYPDIKRLFMSGYTANVIAHHGVLDEGVYFIQKPFSSKDLGAKLRAILENGVAS